MTREHKLALIVGFALVLVLGVLVSDHFSKARQAQMAGIGDIRPPTDREIGTGTAGMRSTGLTAPAAQPEPAAARADLHALPGFAKGDPSLSGGTQLATNTNPGTPLLVHVQRGTEYLPRGDEHYDPPAGVTPPPPVVPQIPMTRYDVKEGDTLYGIAQKIYNDGKLWEKIRDSNKDKLGSGGTLHKGVTLLLPPKDVLLGKPYVPVAAPGTLVNGPRGPLSDPALPKADAKPVVAGDFREYVVKDGDTLVAISRKMLNSGKRFNEIIEANKGTLADPESLSVGMKLRIPAK